MRDEARGFFEELRFFFVAVAVLVVVVMCICGGGRSSTFLPRFSLNVKIDEMDARSRSKIRVSRTFFTYVFCFIYSLLYERLKGKKFRRKILPHILLGYIGPLCGDKIASSRFTFV